MGAFIALVHMHTSFWSPQLYNRILNWGVQKKGADCINARFDAFTEIPLRAFDLGFVSKDT